MSKKMEKLLLLFLGIGLISLIISINNTINHLLMLRDEYKFMEYLFLVLFLFLFFSISYLYTLSAKEFMHDIIHKSEEFKLKISLFFALIGFFIVLSSIFITRIRYEPGADIVFNLVGIWFLIIAYRLYTGFSIKIKEIYQKNMLIFLTILVIIISIYRYNKTTNKIEIVNRNYNLFLSSKLFILFVIMIIISYVGLLFFIWRYYKKRGGIF